MPALPGAAPSCGPAGGPSPGEDAGTPGGPPAGGSMMFYGAVPTMNSKDEFAASPLQSSTVSPGAPLTRRPPEGGLRLGSAPLAGPTGGPRRCRPRGATRGHGRPAVVWWGQASTLSRGVEAGLAAAAGKVQRRCKRLPSPVTGRRVSQARWQRHCRRLEPECYLEPRGGYGPRG